MKKSKPIEKFKPLYYYRIIEFNTRYGKNVSVTNPQTIVTEFRGTDLKKCRRDAFMFYDFKDFQRKNLLKNIPVASGTWLHEEIYNLSLSFVIRNSKGDKDYLLQGDTQTEFIRGLEKEAEVYSELGISN